MSCCPRLLISSRRVRSPRRTVGRRRNWGKQTIRGIGNGVRCGATPLIIHHYSRPPFRIISNSFSSYPKTNVAAERIVKRFLRRNKKSYLAARWDGGGDPDFAELSYFR